MVVLYIYLISYLTPEAMTICVVKAPRVAEAGKLGCCHAVPSTPACMRVTITFHICSSCLALSLAFL